MKVSDMMAAGGRVFFKSEFGQIGDRWPCLSYTYKHVGERLQREFTPGRDVLIYVGTTNSKTTLNPDHRSRLISAITIEPKQVLETRQLVPQEIWAEAEKRWGLNPWPYAMGVTRAAQLVGPPYPEARLIAPQAYSALGEIPNRGNVVLVLDAEREAVMSLSAEPIELSLTAAVQEHMTRRSVLSDDVEKSIKQEAFRMASLIQQRVNSGGEARVVRNPLRTAPNIADLNQLIIQKWQTDQEGKCALCGGPLAQTRNPLLQPSADRIDSDNGAYDRENVQITHLACNYAKNKWGASEFGEWITVLRDVMPEI